VFDRGGFGAHFFARMRALQNCARCTFRSATDEFATGPPPPSPARAERADVD